MLNFMWPLAQLELLNLDAPPLVCLPVVDA